LEDGLSSNDSAVIECPLQGYIYIEVGFQDFISLSIALDHCHRTINIEEVGCIGISLHRPFEVGECKAFYP
jgi:hypothetical protein